MSLSTRGLFWRTLTGLLALTANLVIAGIPVVHAWAHQRSHDDHHSEAVSGGEPQIASEVHPPALHDDCLLIQQRSFDCSAVLPVKGDRVAVFLIEETDTPEPNIGIRSRAPPLSLQSRAPPLS